MEDSARLKFELDASLHLLRCIRETRTQTETDRRYRCILEQSICNLQAKLRRR